MRQYKGKDIPTNEIDFKIYSGEKKSNFETWAIEAKKFVDNMINNRLQYNYKYYKFNHLGKEFFVVDQPKGSRILSNSTGGLYRWGFMETLPGYLTTICETDNEFKEYEIHYLVNKNTAKTATQAINLFKKYVKEVKTGADSLKNIL